MKIKIPSLIVASLFLFSCGQGSDHSSHEEEHAEHEQEESATHEEHDHDDDSQSLQLDSGEKWKVNAEMLPAIQNMEVQINEFVESEEKDYNSLAQGLKSNIDELTSSCTMTGQSHDELHKWLLPYIELVNELMEAETEAQAAEQFENIQTSFVTYNQHFE